MKRIYKYHLDFQGNTTVLMPKDAEILLVNFQENKLYIWAIIDNMEVRMLPRRFSIYGTGHLLGDLDKMKYITTLYKDSFVWHIFENKI